MNGFCRNGNNCVRGSHALLPHQLPVCGYYLRASCTFVEGCPFLHVKNSAKSALCIHFNKGKCLAEFPVCLIDFYYRTPFYFPLILLFPSFSVVLFIFIVQRLFEKDAAVKTMTILWSKNILLLFFSFSSFFRSSTEEEHRFKNFDDIPRLQWFEE